MNVSFYIAKRYLFTKSSNNAINIMTLIAVSGVIVSAAALFIVLSGFGGLKEFSLEFTSLVDPDLKLESAQGKSFVFSEKDSTSLQNIEGVKSISKVIEERVILEFNDKRKLATLKGVDENFDKVTSIKSMIAQGSWLAPETDQVVAGWGLANNLSFGVLDYAKSLTIYVPKPGKGQISSFKSIYNSVSAVNVGVFQINEELNNEYIYADIRTAKYLLNYGDHQITSIELKLLPDANEALVKEKISNVLGGRVTIKNRVQLNDSLYKMLNTENLAVYLIFTLVIIIALFNVIGALIMMILDKKGSLHTLYNLGITTKEIKRIFFLQGSLMTVLGGIIGVTIGLIIVILQKRFDLVMITPSFPYPVTIEIVNVFLVLMTIVLLGLIASKIASGRISEKLVRN